MNRIGRMIFWVVMVALPLSSVRAADSKATDNALDARNAIGTILLSGLIGGVLGLSTLSFYSDPENRLGNITLGAGLAIIVSALVLTVDAATQPPPTLNGHAQLELELPSKYIVPAADSEGIKVLAGLRF